MISSTNLYYTRYDVVAGVAATVQPGSTTVQDLGGVSGWEEIEYKDFSADFVARDADENVRTPQPYVKRGDFGQPVPQGTYVRMDDDNNPVEPQPPLVVGAAGTIYAPDGLVQGRPAAGVIGQYSGGTPPIVVESQFQTRPSGGSWTTVKDWDDTIAGGRILTADDVGLNLRVNTRISDALTGPTIVTGTEVGPVIQKMGNGAKGTVTGTGTVGSTLTQTESAVVGGIGPYVKFYEWRRRPTGTSSFRKITGVQGLTYTVRPEDVGYDIQGTTRWKDAYGYVKVNTTSNNISIT